MDIIVVGLTLRDRTSNGTGKLQVGDFSRRCGVRICVGDVASVASVGCGNGAVVR